MKTGGLLIPDMLLLEGCEGMILMDRTVPYFIGQDFDFHKDRTEGLTPR